MIFPALQRRTPVTLSPAAVYIGKSVFFRKQGFV